MYLPYIAVFSSTLYTFIESQVLLIQVNSRENVLTSELNTKIVIKYVLISELSLYACALILQGTSLVTVKTENFKISSNQCGRLIKIIRKKYRNCDPGYIA